MRSPDGNAPIRNPLLPGRRPLQPLFYFLVIHKRKCDRGFVLALGHCWVDLGCAILPPLDARLFQHESYCLGEWNTIHSLHELKDVSACTATEALESPSAV